MSRPKKSPEKWPFEQLVEGERPRAFFEGEETHEIPVSLKFKGQGAPRGGNGSIVLIATKRTNETKATWRYLLTLHSPSRFFKRFESQTSSSKNANGSFD